MAYLAPIHRPSSIRHALKLNLLDAEDECLVLAKANRVEIWKLSEEGLVMVHSKAIHGRVSMLEKIRPFGATTDHLFIGTARFQYFTVVWNPDTRQLDTVHSFVDVAEKYIQDSQSRDRCLIDPTGKVLAMELYQGILNLVKVVKPRKGNTSYLDTPEQVRITELKVKASAFLYTESKRPKLAILYDAGKKYPDLRLVTYRVLDDKSQYSSFDPIKDRENELAGLDVGASHLIPVSKGEIEQKRYIVRNATAAKAQLGGVVVVGETMMTYMDEESKAVVEHTLNEANIWVAWEKYNDLNYLLADRYARLYLLTINVDGAVVTGMDIKLIGKTTKATVLVHMGQGLLFIASHEGDSQVVRLNIESEEPSIQIIQTMANVAPILDFTVMDMGGRDGEAQVNEYSSGQARLVTGSGGWSEGSLRSVRSGVGLEAVGILADMEDVRGVFALRSNDPRVDDTLVISLSVETRVFLFDSQGEIEEVDSFRGFQLDAQTLLAINLPNDLMLQVTTNRAILSSSQGVHARWTPPGQYPIITGASANDKYLLLSANGIVLATLSLDLGPKKELLFKAIAKHDLEDDQVACVYVPKGIANVGVVGFWKSGTISILDLTTLTILHSEDLRRAEDKASIPRNIALTQILPEETSGPTLFVAMEDGTVLTFNVDKEDFSLSGRKSIVLGSQQAQLEVLPRKNGLFNVFATCEHPSLIYGSEGRIVYSAVTAEDAVHVCSFDSKAYPNSIVVATAENITLSQIDTERRTHVSTLPMGETVRRIAYSTNERAFGIGCMRLDVEDGQEIVKSTFRLVEEIMFGEIGQPFALDVSRGELIECIIRTELPTAYGDNLPAERFLVGTSYLEDDEPVPSPTPKQKGRILVFGIDDERSPYLVMSYELKGACRCLAMMDDKIVAALVKTVVVYRYEETTARSATFSKLATYRTSTNPISMDVTGDIIAVGDMMKSLSLVQFIPGKDGLPDKLEEVARHMQALWSTAVVNIEPDTYLESDHHGNLVVLHRNREGITIEDRKRLEVTSTLNLGEMTNKIVPLNIAAAPNAIVIPQAFIATTEGSIYLFATIANASQSLLMNLQTRMSVIVRTLGDIEFNRYRSFKIPTEEHEEPFRFVDGELIERFLDVDEEVQEEICRGLGPSVEDVRNLVEELKRLH
ncbi:mono-functional DNA-alkylating methyl methanesulfonate N-term-domain-containing protein [Bisporella sp. PMI_857]|nr:mono-functional DNA-alkylating methyl methanesulfonate N-term-domain-containing protein [Bisporella sp. PMI_857]